MMARLRTLAVLASLIAACCTPADGAGLAVAPVSLDDADPQHLQFGRLTYRGGLQLSGVDGFGGLSALLVEGGDLLAISDTGRWFRLGLGHDADGWLRSARIVEQGRLRGLDGRPMRSKTAQDAEAVARSPDGGIVVSFEHLHRLWRYSPDLSAIPTPLAGPPAMRRLPANGGVEAVTELADGRLLLIGERSDAKAASPGWIGRPGAWTPFAYCRDGAFSPTGAALLPDGRVLLVERRLFPPGGRLVVVDPETIASGGTVSGEILLTIEAPLVVDNFEGVAAIADGGGGATVYIVSDDNFSLFQSTLLLSFHLR